MATYQIQVTWKHDIKNLYKDITVIQAGIRAKLNISLKGISHITVNYKVLNQVFTDLCTIDLDNNEIVVPFKTSVLQVGTNQVELVCHLKNGDVLLSPIYYYKVVKSLAAYESVESNDNYPVFIALMQSLAELNNTLNTNEDQRQNNELYRELHEDDRVNSEDIRKANENTRISNENTRKTNETNPRFYCWDTKD